MKETKPDMELLGMQLPEQTAEPQQASTEDASSRPTFRIAVARAAAIAGIGALGEGEAAAQTISSTLGISPASMTFPDTAVGTVFEYLIALTNTSGTETITVSQCFLACYGSNVGQFYVSPLPFNDLPPGQTKNIPIFFGPTSTGRFSATAYVNSNAANGQQSMSIIATGVANDSEADDGGAGASAGDPGAYSGGGDSGDDPADADAADCDNC